MPADNTKSPSHIIISDIHLGSPHCYINEFINFLNSLPLKTELILNGDVIDHWHRELQGIHADALALLRKESFTRKIIWIRGNHDDQYELTGKHNIIFCNYYNIDKRLFISHGYNFDNVMPYHKAFIIFFKMIHHLRIKLGAESVHVARYAKKYPHLYNFLKRHVSANAIEYAKENGYAAVTCGHTHFIEDKTIDGIYYINTGTWTEPPICYIEVAKTEITLKEWFNES